MTTEDTSRTDGLAGRFRDADQKAELELRADGSFSFHGIWSGYEVTIVDGTWSRREAYIHLTGTGSMHADFGGFSHASFHATFLLRDDGSVVSETGAPGWSLLATREPLRPIPPDTPRLIDQMSI
ncbi:MAG: hypothetical protein ACYDEB_10570 [Dehalococcoidia bacterium]